MRKTKWKILILTSALALAFLRVQAAIAAGPAKQDQPHQAASNEKPQKVEVYRAHYKVDEVENGKTINSRSYTMTVNTGSSATIRIGSRVPYNTGKSIYYQDIGMDINCYISNREGRIIVHTKISLMSLAEKQAGLSTPVFRQFQFENSAVAILEKPLFVGSADDVASNRRYVIEVTVTKAK